MTIPDAGPVLPTPDVDTAPYWAGLHVGELRIQRCDECGRFQHFPGPICASCLSFSLSFVPVSGAGTVYSYVVIERATTEYFGERVPYAVAWVELPEQSGLRVLGQIVECDPYRVNVGLEVQVVFSPLNDRFTVAQFAPISAVPSDERRGRQ